MLEMLKERPWAILTADLPRSPSARVKTTLAFRVFSNESVLHFRWPKDWNFSFNISPSDEIGRASCRERV